MLVTVGDIIVSNDSDTMLRGLLVFGSYFLMLTICSGIVLSFSEIAVFLASDLDAEYITIRKYCIMLLQDFVKTRLS